MYYYMRNTTMYYFVEKQYSFLSFGIQPLVSCLLFDSRHHCERAKVMDPVISYFP